jgi:hypothetical protein
MSSDLAYDTETDFSSIRSEFSELYETQNKLTSFVKNYKKIFNRRHHIIEYYLDLHIKLKTSIKTLHMAISLFDNFMVNLDSNTDEGESLDLIQITKISLTGFYVAYKFEEPYQLTIDTVQKYFIRNSSIFTKEEFIDLEKLFLKTLKFHLLYINIFSFHECFYDFLYHKFLKTEDIENIVYKNMIKQIIRVNEQIITVVTNFKEIMFKYEDNESYDTLKLSDLAVVSLKISIFFFDSNYEKKKKKLKNFNEIVNEFFMIDQLNNLKLNRNAFNLFSLIRDLMKDEDKKIFRCLKEILVELNLTK